MSRLSPVVWAEILAHLRLHYPDLVHAGFSRLECNDVGRGVLTVHVADEQLWRHLDQKCRSAFADAARTVTGYLVAVDFVQRAAADAAPRAATFDRDLRLNPQYIFDHFVIGPE